MSRIFDHEKLDVYQTSLAFIAWLEPVLQRLALLDRIASLRGGLGSG